MLTVKSGYSVNAATDPVRIYRCAAPTGANYIASASVVDGAYWWWLNNAEHSCPGVAPTLTGAIYGAIEAFEAFHGIGGAS